MADLTGQALKDTYKDLLQVSNSNAGVTSTLTQVSDGEGTNSALQLSTTTVNVDGTFKVGGYTVTVPAAVTFGGAFTTSGSSALTFITTGTTSLTLPTSGTVATLADIPGASEPGFLAKVTSTISDVTGDNTAYDIVFGTEIFDTTNNFSSTTFTAPSTGHYIFNIQVALNNFESAVSHSALLQLVTSNRTYTLANEDATTASVGASSQYVFNCSAIADLDSADTAKVTLTVSGSLKDVDVLNTSYFSCKKLF